MPQRGDMSREYFWKLKRAEEAAEMKNALLEKRLGRKPNHKWYPHNLSRRGERSRYNLIFD